MPRGKRKADSEGNVDENSWNEAKTKSAKLDAGKTKD